MKIGIDAGHGFANASANRYDPGAVGNGLEEASVTLSYALMLDDAAKRRGHDTVMVRRDAVIAAPVGLRAKYYEDRDCDVLISFHCNASDDAKATGTETLYFYTPVFADQINRSVVEELGLRNRGIKSRPGLALMKFKRPCALIELGFITNPVDAAAIALPTTIAAVADAILSTITRRG